MTEQQINDQIETLKTVGEKATASKEAAQQFLRDAGIIMHPVWMTTGALTDITPPVLADLEKH
jgi:hypothetical protein